MTALGERLNAHRRATRSTTSTSCAWCSTPRSPSAGATGSWPHRLPPERTVVVVNKIDRAAAARSSAQLARGGRARRRRPTSRCRPRTGDGVTDARRAPRSRRLPEGPQLLPGRRGQPTCPRRSGWPSWCASSCCAVTHDELPYSIATRVTEWEWPRIRVEILVERESQKGMVIGKGGAVLKEVGTAARGAAARGRLPRAVRQGRQGLAAPPRPHRPPRVLGLGSGPAKPCTRGCRPAGGGLRPTACGRRALGAGAGPRWP